MNTKISIDTFSILHQQDQVDLTMSEGLFKCFITDHNGDLVNFYQLGSFFVTIILNNSEENEEIGSVKHLRTFSTGELIMYYPQMSRLLLTDSSGYQPVRMQSIFPESKKTKAVGQFKNYLC